MAVPINCPPKYFLVACGTSQSSCPEVYAPLPSVPSDLNRVSRLLTDEYGYERILEEFSLNPDGKDLIQHFAKWLISEERSQSDHVIFYYSGHGEFLSGDRHYLILEKTDPSILAQTALPTEDLIRPLGNDGVKVSQILFIIDTCYSGEAASDISGYAAKVIQRFQPVRGDSILLHTIAACRSKQTATEGVLSRALKNILINWDETYSSGYIPPDLIVDKINQFLNVDTQRIQHTKVAGEELARFFPHVPRTLRNWEQERSSLVRKLVAILMQVENGLVWVNSFLLSNQRLHDIAVDQDSLGKALTALSELPVSDGICLLYACAEWCREIIFLESNQLTYEGLSNQLEMWQTSAIQSRSGVVPEKVQDFVQEAIESLKMMLEKEEIRLLVTLEPEIETENATGVFTNVLLMSMSLWVKNESRPWGRYAQNIAIHLQEYRAQGLELEESLYESLKKTNILADLVTKARYSVPECFSDVLDLTIELFLPLDFVQCELELLLFVKGRGFQALGKEYPMIINSYERYFENEYRPIRNRVAKKKKELWSGSIELPEICQNPDLDPEDLYQFEDFDLYMGTAPSRDILERIQHALPIAVWGRNKKVPLIAEQDLRLSDWSKWPSKVYQLRRKRRELPVTLFWDDDFPKPKRYSRPLSTRVVE